MIEAVLENISTTYTWIGGGGITEIKRSDSNTIVVSLPQEERTDLLTYELGVSEDCRVHIVKRSEGAESYSRAPQPEP
jgi:hypothetical protein